VADAKNEEPSSSRSPTSERRPVGQFALLALGINGIVGVGIFFVPSDVAQHAPGFASVLVFALTALLLTPVAIAQAKLGGCFDEDGGPVVFAREAFGALPSFLVGWLTYLSSIFSAAAIMVGLSKSVTAHPAAPYVVCTVLALVCAGGVPLSARVWTTLTVLKLVPLVGLVVLSLFLMPAAPSAPAPVGMGEVHWLRAMLTTVFIYQGFEIVPVIAGQAKSPAKAIPRAVLGSLFLSALLYVLLQRACVLAIPNLSGSSAPLADAAKVLAGARASTIVQIGTSVSALGIAVGMMVMTPRFLSALAKGDTLPFAFHELNANGVPVRALIVTWIAVMALMLLGSRAELFSLSSLAVVLQYAVASASLVRLAFARMRGLKPIDAWSAIPALGVGIVLAAGAARTEWAVAAGSLLLGLALHGAWRLRSRA
jgi:amino acid transporter